MKTNSLHSWVLALPILLFGVEVAHAQCKPGDILVGADADNYYCMKKPVYEGSAAQQYGRQFCQAKQVVAADQTAIRALGFTTDAERFEMYGDVATGQKAQFQHRILNALFDQGLNATQVMVNKASSLNPWNVNTAVRTLEESGFDNAVVVMALRSIARQRDKPAMAAAYRDFAQKLKGAKEGWETRTDMSTDTKNAKLRLALGALKIMQGNPELGLVITGLQFGENIAYLLYLTNRIDDLTAATDAHLARLHELSERLQSHVTAMLANKRAWRNSTGYSTGTPVCGP
jgi:hypothetical protein